MTTQTETAPAAEQANGVRAGRIVLPAELDWDAIRSRLAGIMRDRGFGQRALADAAHIGSHASLSKFLSGKSHELDIATLAAIAMALELDLEALAGIEPAPADEGEAGPLRMIPLDLIVQSLLNPRTNFDPETIDGLADNIAADGLLQPLVVRPGDDGGYLLVAGERRWHAFRKLIGAGTWPRKRPVPCVVRADIDDETHLTLALAENVQREDLTPLEEAAAFHKLMVEFDWNTERIAAHFGKTQRWVQQRLGLLELTATAREALAQGILPAAAARHLPRLTDLEQNKLVDDIIGGDLLPHEARILTRIRSDEARRAAPEGDPEQMDIEDLAPPEEREEEPGGNSREYALSLGEPHHATVTALIPANREGWHWIATALLPGDRSFNSGPPLTRPATGRERDAVRLGAEWLARQTGSELQRLAGRTGGLVAQTRQALRKILAWTNDLIETRGGEAVPFPYADKNDPARDRDSEAEKNLARESAGAKADYPNPDFTPPPPEDRLARHAALPPTGAELLCDQPDVADEKAYRLEWWAPEGPGGWPASFQIRHRDKGLATYRLERIPQKD